MLISGIESIITSIFEVPSGIFADYWGHKNTVVLGTAAAIVAAIAYIAHPSFAFFILAEILLAFSGAMLSGATMSLIYGKFEKADAKVSFSGFASLLSGQGHAVAAIVALLSSFLFAAHMYMPFAATIAALTISLPFLCAIEDSENSIKKETARHAVEDSGSVGEKDATRLDPLSLAKDFLRSRKLVAFSLISSMFILLMSNISYLSQAYLAELGYPIRFLGLFSFSCNIAASVGALKSPGFFKRFARHGFACAAFSLGACACLLSVKSLFLAMPLYLIARFFSGAVFPRITSEIIKETHEGNRASMLSLVSLVEGGFMAATDPLLGLVIDRHGIGMMYLILGAIALMISACVYIYDTKVRT
jgi:MFS family permease